MLICLILCMITVLASPLSPTVLGRALHTNSLRNNYYSLAPGEQMSPSDGFLHTQANRLPRNGGDFDTLLGHSFGSQKRSSRYHMLKKNFDEIDNAGFRDYLAKRTSELNRRYYGMDFYPFDYSGKRFKPLIAPVQYEDYGYPRNKLIAKKNFDEIDNAGFNDYLVKRNFDEIDNAGFNDYLVTKKSDTEFENPQRVAKNEQVSSRPSQSEEGTVTRMLK